MSISILLGPTPTSSCREALMIQPRSRKAQTSGCSEFHRTAMPRRRKERLPGLCLQRRPPVASRPRQSRGRSCRRPSAAAPSIARLKSDIKRLEGQRSRHQGSAKGIKRTRQDQAGQLLEGLRLDSSAAGAPPPPEPGPRRALGVYFYFVFCSLCALHLP